MKAKNTDKNSLETKGQSTLISQLASNRNSFWCQSLKIRITVFTLVLFVSSLFTIIFYANKLMREEIQRFLATQHLLSVSYPSTHSLQQHLLFNSSLHP
jgi:hypothetical protein